MSELSAPLLNFATAYVAPFSNYSEIRTEHLADAFRGHFGLSSFPTMQQLEECCASMGIELASMQISIDDLDGINAWYGEGNPLIQLRPDLTLARAETTLGHELREVIENAFVKVKPTYVPLLTHNNRRMNRQSDHFAACLLMESGATRRSLTSLGYDYVEFSRQSGRSLPSVIVRLQTLYPAGSSEATPVGGVWLFEAPWVDVKQGRSRARDLRVLYGAKLNGFSTSRAKRSLTAALARDVFPRIGQRAEGMQCVADALVIQQPTSRVVRGFDLFRERDWLLVAEPFHVRGYPWRCLLTAARLDFQGTVQPWLTRCGPVQLPELYQSA